MRAFPYDLIKVINSRIINIYITLKYLIQKKKYKLYQLHIDIIHLNIK